MKVVDCIRRQKYKMKKGVLCPRLFASTSGSRDRPCIEYKIKEKLKLLRKVEGIHILQQQQKQMGGVLKEEGEGEG